MAKYHELVERYKVEIVEIKQDRKREKELQTQASDLIYQINNRHFTEHQDEKMADLYEKLRDVEYERGLLAERLEEAEFTLNEMVYMAYEDTPFQRTRLQGVSGFYREAGL